MKQYIYRGDGSRIMGAVGLMGVVVLSLLGTGCVHPIALGTGDSTWQYRIDAAQQIDAAIVVVIDDATRAGTFGFRAFSTGIAHK